MRDASTDGSAGSLTLDRRPLIIGGYDTETTGLNEPGHRIIEACVVTYEYDPLAHSVREIECWVQRINPERNIDARSREIHGISESDLVGKPKWGDVAPALTKRLNRLDVCVAHNGIDFDFPFTIRELERISHPLPDFEPFDTMLEGRWATPFGKAPSLQELCWSCNVDYNPAEAHAAEYDVRKMMACFFFGLRRNVFTLSTN